MAMGLSNNLLRMATINLRALADPIFDHAVNVKVLHAIRYALQQLDVAGQMLARQQLDGGELAPRKQAVLDAGGGPGSEGRRILDKGHGQYGQFVGHVDAPS